MAYIVIADRLKQRQARVEAIGVSNVICLRQTLAVL